ncbi:hypothetical protein HAX54_023097 [Datura stramonium]|uniref:Uncharacterized protein n=1 Tax=Datura stramonium TaxID=4076 RepID=A0ABS8Y5H8_DATST|nr:hypothetical protein [Datura stramonium]
MAKSQKNSPLFNRKSTRTKEKGKASSYVPVDSDVSNHCTLPMSSDTSQKLPEKCLGDLGDCVDSKKKFKFEHESFLDGNVDFWGSSYEALFQSLKDKTLVHVESDTLVVTTPFKIKSSTSSTSTLTNHFVEILEKNIAMYEKLESFKDILITLNSKWKRLRILSKK